MRKSTVLGDASGAEALRSTVLKRNPFSTFLLKQNVQRKHKPVIPSQLCGADLYLLGGVFLCFVFF